RDTLPGLQPFLRQIHGALTVLRFTEAARALSVCEEMIALCSEPSYEGVPDDMDWIAEGLSSIGMFLEPCLHGREPAEHAIELFFRRYEKAHIPVHERALDTTVVLSAAALKKAAGAAPALEKTQPMPKPAAVPAAAPAAVPAPPRPGVDAELLAVYLEEAGEVLGSIQSALASSRAQPQDQDLLTTIRRGFHTLKGSGRMVGLMDLGEVAWEVEQVMNRWMQNKWPASAELHGLIERAREGFAGWVAQLRAGSLAGEIDARDLVALAAKLRAQEAPPAAPAAAPASAPAPAPAAPPESIFAEVTAMPNFADVTAFPETVIIGATRLAPHMFEIYMKEARQHVGALEREFQAWRLAPGEASKEFLRAAHTLASSSSTAGFAPIASLAAALEQWMPVAPRGTSAKDAKIVQIAVKGLRERIDTLARREPPAAPDEAEAALRALSARLLAKPVQAKPAAAAREQRVMRDDIDQQLLPIFLEEAQLLLPQIGTDLRDWRAHPEDEKVQQSLQRALHTLKGSARMAGAIRLGELAHVMEGRIEAALEAGKASEALFVDLEEKMDRLSLDIERMAAGPEVEAAPAPEPAAAARPAAAPTAVAAATAPRAEPAPRREAPLPAPTALLRVSADTIDHLINESGEVAIARSRVEAELRAVKQSIADLNESIARLRNQLREVEVQADSQMRARASEVEERKGEFDPLEFDRYTRLQELTRLMAESLHDADAIQQSLRKSLGETDAALAQQSRTTRDVQQELMRMRAVPFSILDERLYRIVRQTTRELGKKAELHIEGSQVELDRSVMDRIGAPLEHMLRNSLAHGIEAPAGRAAAGKPETGRITLSLRQEGNEIALVVSDDGAGLDLERLRRKAESAGLLQPGQEVPPAELAQLIFVSGLSTAEAVTELAGRGIGMDVVKSEIAAVGGRIDIANTPGQGCAFTVYLPLTLAVTQ
ncbi:MAG TPA: Hpt domain-containing protein, partial [Burkholderiales bacterium]